ncbi:MAG: FRG domain-containing protein [Flavobacterium sp.]|nr:MAG: FRG domain-containing protein [Flavobacterium sp.]
MIQSEKELLERIVEIKTRIPETSLLLFRGQTRLYDKIRSGRARPDTIVVPEVENGWNTIVNRLTRKNSTTKFNQAILQHYGLPTFYIDLTSDPLTAAWFACNRYQELEPTMWIGNTFRFQDETTYNPIKDEKGYVFVLEIPDHKEMVEKNELFDLTREDIFLRPQHQSAFLMLDQPPRLPNPNSFIIETLEIDRTKFTCSKTLKELFPNPKNDKGYGSLLDVPYVQLPSFYFSNKEKKEESEANDKMSIDMDKFFVVGKRAIKIPIYIEGKDDLFEFNPKWKDTVIYEPSPFRLWKTENFNISQIHEGQNGVFGDTAKITMSPIAFNKLFSDTTEPELAWPLVNSNSIFFTKAVLDHDKVIDHEPPYVGIWLHKDNNLILELHLVADEEEMHLRLGHAFVLENNKLTYVRVDKECDCGKPDDHVHILTSLLKMHALIKRQEVALVQHAFGIDNWFVLL